MYELWKSKGGWMGGSSGFGSICDEIRDTGLLSKNMRDQVALAELGHQFAVWLTRNGKKAAYFNSTLGGWGEQPSGLPEPNVPPGFSWPFGQRGQPDAHVAPPSQTGPTGQTVFSHGFPPGIFGGMRQAPNTQEEQQATGPSPIAAAETAQVNETPWVAPAPPAQAAQPSPKTAELDGKA
jgi:hypothetical protein